MGAQLHNPVRNSATEELISPSILEVGIGYQVNEALMIAVEVEKDIDFPLRLKAGLEYQLAEPLWLRIGVGQAPEQISGGLGLQILPGMVLDVSVSNHPILGFSPGIGWVYRKP
jgi:hypothetical protein